MTKLIQSKSDKREYKYLTLPNKLRVLLISDPEADKSAASMDVGAGSALDDPRAKGIAHFCEHMLFMGNEKYPDESEYATYITKNGGMNNAFTALECTNY